jgi:hypothetical protein
VRRLELNAVLEQRSASKNKRKAKRKEMLTGTCMAANAGPGTNALFI